MINSRFGQPQTHPTVPDKEVILAPDIQRNPRSLEYMEGRNREGRTHQRRANQSTRSLTPEGPNPKDHSDDKVT